MQDGDRYAFGCKANRSKLKKQIKLLKYLESTHSNLYQVLKTLCMLI